MKRIMVIGSSGAGKSTFSKKLSQITNIELIHLDLFYWKPDWKEPDKAEWSTQVQEIAKKPAWIIDGNYGGTMDYRIERADTILFLNYSTRKSLWRVIKRTIKYWNKSRPDMPKNCKERFDFKFMMYVASFNFKRKAKLLNKLSVYKNEKTILIFQNDSQATEFLKRVELNMK